MTNGILIVLTFLMFVVLCLSVKRNIKLSTSMEDIAKVVKAKTEEHSRLHESWLKQSAWLATKMKDLSDANGELLAAQSQISACRNEIGENRALIQSLRNDAAEREQLVTRLLAEKHSLQAAIDNRDRTIAVESENWSAGQKAIERLSKERDEWKAAKLQETEDVISARKKLADATERCEMYIKSANNACSERDRMRAELASIKCPPKKCPVKKAATKKTK